MAENLAYSLNTTLNIRQYFLGDVSLSCFLVSTLPTQQFEVRSILREYYNIVSSSSIRTQGDRNLLLTFAYQFIKCRYLWNIRVNLKNEHSAIHFYLYSLKLNEFNITAAHDNETWNMNLHNMYIYIYIHTIRGILFVRKGHDK